MARTLNNPIPRDSDPYNQSEKSFLRGILNDPGPGAFFRRPTLTDNFFNFSTTTWTGTATGTTGSDVPLALLATGAGGQLVMTSGTGALEAQEMGGASVGWTPSTMGPISLEARIKRNSTTTPTLGDFSIGFADAVTYTSGVPHIVGASSLYTTDLPVEFAGFHYSSIPTSGTLYHLAGNYIGIKTAKNGTGPVAVSSTVVIDSLWHIYRVELDTIGNAEMFIDDVSVGTVALAVTAATALTPYFQVHAQGGKEHAMNIDWVCVTADHWSAT